MKLLISIFLIWGITHMFVCGYYSGILYGPFKLKIKYKFDYAE